MRGATRPIGTPRQGGSQRWVRRARRVGLATWALILLSGWVRGQEAAFVPLPLRVLRSEDGLLVVDRGLRDGLAAGDRVELRPRDGLPVLAIVRRCDERSARVQPGDRSAELPPGTRGVAWLPRERLEPVEASGPPPATPPSGGAGSAGAPDAAVPDHPPWSRRDDQRPPGLPLLVDEVVPRPSQRPTRLSGHLWASSTTTGTSESGRAHAFQRLGLATDVDNPFGRGGWLEGVFETNARVTERPDDASDEERRKLRVEQLAYSWGGTRWEAGRHQVGRFFQTALPELGRLDGYAYERRLDDGQRVATSVGFLPEPDRDLDTGEDLAVSASWRWVADESGSLSVAAGLQKTWHRGEADRDLLVLSGHALPLDGWQLQASAWLDWYTADDTRDGLEVSEVRASAVRQLDDGRGLGLSYTRRRVPELLRDASFGATPASDLDHRIDLRHWMPLDGRTRWRTDVGLWTGADGRGGDLALGADVDDLLQRGGTSSATVFAVDGATSLGLGARLGHGWPVAGGRWDLAYHVAEHDNDGFSEAFDDVVQHRLGVTRWLSLDRFWDLSASGDLSWWGDERAWTLGLSLQRTF